MDLKILNIVSFTSLSHITRQKVCRQEEKGKAPEN